MPDNKVTVGDMIDYLSQFERDTIVVLTNKECLSDENEYAVAIEQYFFDLPKEQ